MTEREVDADILRRHFVAIATGEYQSPHWSSLPVDSEVKALRDWLCADELAERRFVPTHPQLTTNPTRSAIRDALEDPHPDLRWREADAAVVYVSGHGTTTSDNTHWTVLEQTEPDRIRATALRTADLVGWLADTDIRHLLVILDLCYAGRTIAETATFDRDIPATWLVLPSAPKDQQAESGALTQAVTAFLAELASAEGQKYGVHDRLLDVAVFLEEVERRLGQRLIPLPGSQRTGPHACLPNPHYRAGAFIAVRRQRRDLALLEQDLRTHWDPRSRGVEVGEPQWLFTGRTSLMIRLIAATDGPAGTVLVTGSAGSGKSAVLARLVTLSDPLFLAEHAEAIAAIPTALRPAQNAVDVAVLATGKTGHEVIAQICRALEVWEPTDAHVPISLDEWIDAWQSWLARRERPVTVVIDALDEATDPVGLLTDVLARLEVGHGTQRRLRLLLGVRSPSRGHNQLVADGESRTQSLADQAEARLRAERIRVDEEPWWCEDDVSAYASEVLTQTPNSPYATNALPVDRTAAVARVLAAHAGTSFLVTRIAATSLACREAAVDPTDPTWLASIREGVLGVFRDDVITALPDPEDRLRAVHLLRAVAFGRGRGLPWRQIWPAVANAVAFAEAPDRVYGDSDIAWLLRSPLGAYLVADVADGTTVYRLYHDALRAPLQARWRDLLGEPDDPDGPDEQAAAQLTEQRIARKLAAITEEALSSPWGQAPSTYVRRHLTEHAHAGDVLNDRVISARFLPFADASRLRPLLFANRAGSPPHQRSAESVMWTAFRHVTHLWDFEHPQGNACALEMWSAGLGRQLDTGGGAGQPWGVRWARWLPSSGELLAHRIGTVSTLATAVLPDGRTVVVTGSGDGEHVWDLVTGESAGPPLMGHTDHVNAVATTMLPDGRAVAVTGSSDGTVRMWDLTTCRPVDRPFTGHRADVLAVATVAMPDGRALAVSGGRDGKVMVWDLTRHQPVGQLLADHSGEVRSVATASLPDGRLVALAAVEGEAAVRAWDLGTGQPTARYLVGHTGEVLAVATAVLAPGKVVAVTGGNDATVRVWNLMENQPVGQPMEGHGDSVVAVATGELADGRVVAVTGSYDGTARVWDLGAGRLMGDPLIGHTNPPWTVATVTPPDGRSLAVTGSNDEAVRVWNLAEGEPGECPGAGHLRRGHAVATATLPDGRAVLVVGGSTVEVFDLYTGEPIGRLLDGDHGGAWALAAAVLPDGRAVAVSSDLDERLLVWDLTSRQLIGRCAAGGDGLTGPLATAALPDGRAVAVAGDRDGLLYMWDLPTCQLIGQFGAGSFSRVHAVSTAVLPDGCVVAVIDGGDETLHVLNLSTGEPVVKMPIGRSDPHDLGAVLSLATAVLPDKRSIVVVGGYDPSARVLDLTTGELVGELAGHSDWVKAAVTTVLPNGRVVAVTSSQDDTVWAWDLETGELIGPPLPTIGEITSLASLSPSGRQTVLAIAGRGIAVVTLDG
ncbi:hypothetical protein VM98_28595 [Streptomyces rubellomurinus subsp. indigoferus]|nr:hypothetical protein VM98_28595 [Streptomyces rubellomurinus subsp. indigoferus]